MPHTDKMGSVISDISKEMNMSKTLVVTRHAGAVEWLQNYGFADCEVVNHFTPEMIKAGDVVVGILPLNLVAEVNLKGGRFFALDLVVPAELRGIEMTAEMMTRLGAKIQEYRVSAIS